MDSQTLSAQQQGPIDKNARDLLGDVYRRYSQELCAYVRQKFGSGPPDPEDVVQTAFERFAGLDAPEAIDNPRAFLYRTSQNIVIDHYRATTTRDKHVEQEKNQAEQKSLDDSTPENVLIAKERMEIVQQVVENLPNRQRQLVLLNRFHQVSYAEIARRTGMSQTEIKRQVARALAECDQALASAEQALESPRTRR